MKVAHLTTAHPVFDVRIFHKECRSLAAAGYEVHLIASYHRDEEIDGVKILGISVGGGRFRRVTLGLWQAFWRALSTKSKIYHLHDPELIIVGLALRLLGKKVIFDAHEDFTVLPYDRSWVPNIAAAPLSLMVRFLIFLGGRFFSAIVAATPKVAQNYPQKKRCIVMNYPSLEEFNQQKTSEKIAASSPATFCYVGVISEARGILDIIAAVGNLPEEDEAHLLIGGNFEGSGILSKAKKTNGWDRTQALGLLSREQVFETFAKSCAGLFVGWPSRNHIESYPTKIFEYMASGLPVIISDFPLWRDLLLKYEFGLCVQPKDPETITSAMRWIIDHPDAAREMGQRGQRLVREKWNWGIEKVKLVELYRSLAGQPTAVGQDR